MHEEDWEEVMDEEEDWSKITEHPHVLTLTKALNKIAKDGYKGWVWLGWSSSCDEVAFWKDGAGNDLSDAVHASPALSREFYNFVMGELTKAQYKPYLSDLPFERRSLDAGCFKIKKG